MYSYTFEKINETGIDTFVLLVPHSPTPIHQLLIKILIDHGIEENFIIGLRKRPIRKKVYLEVINKKGNKIIIEIYERIITHSLLGIPKSSNLRIELYKLFKK